jgi:hypothetical protein
VMCGAVRQQSTTRQRLQQRFRCSVQLVHVRRHLRAA